MESPIPLTCFSDPNFASIAGFIDKFGKVCGVLLPTISDLVSMLECKDTVPQDLIILHVALLRRVRRSVPIEKWEKAAVKYCQMYSLQDAAILEQHGYLNCGLDIKLRFLKNLLESQFDHNTKLKTAVNLLTAEELRPKPAGKDESGRVYWVQLDPTAQLRIYREDQESEDKNWTLITQDREGLVNLLKELTGDESLDLSVVVDASESKDDTVLDTGQETENDSEGNEEEAIELSDGAAELDDDEEADSFTETVKATSHEPESSAIAHKDCSEAIEEPVMVVTGVGSGMDCETGRPLINESCFNNSSHCISLESVNESDLFSDVIEDPVFYVYGLGSGADCEIGNPERLQSDIGNNDVPETAPSSRIDATVSDSDVKGEELPILSIGATATAVHMDADAAPSSGLGNVAPRTIEEPFESSDGPKSHSRVWSITDICGPQKEDRNESKAVYPNEQSISITREPSTYEKLTIANEDKHNLGFPLQGAIKNDLNLIPKSIVDDVDTKNTVIGQGDECLKEGETPCVNKILSIPSAATSNKALGAFQPDNYSSNLAVPEIIITPNTPTGSDLTFSPGESSTVNKSDCSHKTDSNYTIQTPTIIHNDSCNSPELEGGNSDKKAAGPISFLNQGCVVTDNETIENSVEKSCSTAGTSQDLVDVTLTKISCETSQEVKKAETVHDFNEVVGENIPSEKSVGVVAPSPEPAVVEASIAENNSRNANMNADTPMRNNSLSDFDSASMVSIKKLDKLPTSKEDVEDTSINDDISTANLANKNSLVSIDKVIDATIIEDTPVETGNENVSDASHKVPREDENIKSASPKASHEAAHPDKSVVKITDNHECTLGNQLPCENDKQQSLEPQLDKILEQTQPMTDHQQSDSVKIPKEDSIKDVVSLELKEQKSSLKKVELFEGKSENPIDEQKGKIKGIKPDNVSKMKITKHSGNIRAKRKSANEVRAHSKTGKMKNQLKNKVVDSKQKRETDNKRSTETQSPREEKKTENKTCIETTETNFIQLEAQTETPMKNLGPQSENEEKGLELDEVIDSKQKDVQPLACDKMEHPGLLVEDKNVKSDSMPPSSGAENNASETAEKMVTSDSSKPVVLAKGKKGTRRKTQDTTGTTDSVSECMTNNADEKDDVNRPAPVGPPARKSLRSRRLDASKIKRKSPAKSGSKKISPKAKTAVLSKKEVSTIPQKTVNEVKTASDSASEMLESDSSVNAAGVVDEDPLALDESNNTISNDKKAGQKQKLKKTANKKRTGKTKTASGKVKTPTKSMQEKKSDGVDTAKRYQNAVSAREMKLLGVSMNAEFNETSERSVRTSRRIAQIKIKEQQERRHEEEAQLAQFKKTGKKSHEKNGDDKTKKSKKKGSNKKKNEDDEDYDDADDSKEDKKTNKKYHKKLKFNDQNPWLHSSDSSTMDEDLDEYEDEEPQDEEQILKSDHEFSPESDMDEDPEYRPVQKARTARARAEGKDDKYEDTACEGCKEKERPEWILLCDGCDKGWHTDCLKPILHLVPEGQWFCPPCSHEALINQLKLTLREFDRLEKQRGNEELRKKRLAFVGISLDNVLPSKKKKQSVKDSESESDANSSSGSNSSDSEPVYQLRERRTNVTSYRYNEYDDMIRSAIQEDLPPKAPKPSREIEDDEETEDDEDLSKVKQPEKASVKQLPLVVNEVAKKGETSKEEDQGKDESDDYAGETEEDELLDEPPPVVPRNRNITKQKKRKKLTMDFSSDEEDDDRNSDSDFKGSTEPSESEDASHSGSSEGWGRKNRGPVRRSTRRRQRRYDKDFINDDTSDEEDNKSTRKRMRRDICSDESSDSDRSWGGSGKRKRTRRTRLPTPPRWVKKKRKHKKQKRPEGSDEDKPKKRRVVYGGLDDSDDGKVLTRRTRGRQINYIEANDEDSEDENLKGRKKKRESDKESDAEFVAEPDKDGEEDEEEEEDEYVQEGDSDESTAPDTTMASKSAPSKVIKKKPKNKNVIKDSESEDDESEEGTSPEKTKNVKTPPEEMKKKSKSKTAINYSESEEDDVDQYLEDLDDEAEEKLMGMLEKGDLPVDQLKAAVRRAKEETKQKTGEKCSDVKKNVVAEEKVDDKPKRKNVKITPTRAELEAERKKEKALEEKKMQSEENSDEETVDSDDESDENSSTGGLLLRSLQGQSVPKVGNALPPNELPATIPSAVASSYSKMGPDGQHKPGFPNMLQQPTVAMISTQAIRGQFQPPNQGGISTLQHLQNMPLGGQYRMPGFQGPHPAVPPLQGNAPNAQYPQTPPGNHPHRFPTSGPRSQMGQVPHNPSPMTIPHSGQGARQQGAMLMRPQVMQGPPRPHGMQQQGAPGHFMPGQPTQSGPHASLPSGQQPPGHQTQHLPSPPRPGMPPGAPMIGTQIPGQHPQSHIPPPVPGTPNPLNSQSSFPQQSIQPPLSDLPETPVKQRKKPGPKPGSKNKKKTDEEIQTQAAAKGRPRGKRGDDVTIATVQAPTQFPDAVNAEGGSVITRMLNSPQGARPVQEPSNPRFPGPHLYHAAHPLDPSPSGGAAVSIAKPPFGQENMSQFQLFQRQHFTNFNPDPPQNFPAPPFSEPSNFTPPPQHAQPLPPPPPPPPQVAEHPPVVAKSFDEDGGGEFGGLASYFASQAEDDLDT